MNAKFISKKRCFCKGNVNIMLRVDNLFYFLPEKRDNKWDKIIRGDISGNKLARNDISISWWIRSFPFFH